MKIDRRLFHDIEDEFVAPPQGGNPQKFYPGLFEKKEVEVICNRLNEDREAIGDPIRVFPRRVGNGVTSVYGDGEPELPVEVISADGFEEIECSSAISEDFGKSALFELWRVDMNERVDNERLFHACAEGFQDIFDGTYYEDTFQMGL